MRNVYLLLLLILNLQSRITSAQETSDPASDPNRISETVTNQSRTINRMTINIQASDTNGVSAQAIGLLKTNIDANQKELFHITDQLLKNAVFKLSGQQTEVFIEDVNDLYDNYNLEPLEMVLKPNGTKLNVIKNDVILNKLVAYNHDAFDKTQSITLTGNVEDTVTCSYKQKDVFPVEITHNIDVNSLGNGPSWNMKGTFGKDWTETRIVPVVNASFIINLRSKQDVTAILSATKVTAFIQVNYLAVLTGHVLAKFENSYIWGYENYDIETVMSAAGMPHSVMLREEVTVEYYKDCVIKVYGDVQATNGVNLCAFSVVDSKEDTDLHWRSFQAEQQKISIANALPGILKPLENGANRNSVTVLLTLFGIFLKIQSF